MIDITCWTIEDLCITGDIAAWDRHGRHMIARGTKTVRTSEIVSTNGNIIQTMGNTYRLKGPSRMALRVGAQK